MYGAYAPGIYHDLVLRKPELVAQAVQVVLRCPETSTTNVVGTRQMVTLPKYEATRSTAVNSGRGDEREARFATVLLRI